MNSGLLIQCYGQALWKSKFKSKETFPNATPKIASFVQPVKKGRAFWQNGEKENIRNTTNDYYKMFNDSDVIERKPINPDTGKPFGTLNEYMEYLSRFY